MADNKVDAGKEIKKAADEKAEKQRFDKLSSDLVKNREANSKDQSHIKNQLSENAKKQWKSMKDMAKPSSLIKAVGLSTGSPFLAIMGSQLGDLIATNEEEKEASKSENKKLAELLKKNGKSSSEIEKILEDTKRLSGDNEDEIKKKLSELGFSNKEVFDKFISIKKEGDEKLIAANYDVISGLEAQGLEEKEHASKLRQLLDDKLKNPLTKNAQGVFISRTEQALENLGVHIERIEGESKADYLQRQEVAFDELGVDMKEASRIAAEGTIQELRELAKPDQLQEQKDDEKIEIASRQTEATELLVGYVRSISEDLKDLAEDLGKADFGLGTIVGLIAAPIFMLVGFFQGMTTQIKWLAKWAKSTKLAKLFAPITKFFLSIKDLKIFKVIPDVGKLIMKVVNPILNIFKSISKFGTAAAKFGSSFGFITKFAQKFGSLLGKLFLPFQIIMGAFHTITGFIDGFKTGGIVGGIKGALIGLFDGLVGSVVQMLADGAAFVLRFFGMNDLANTIQVGVAGMLDSVKAVISDVVQFFADIFSFDPATMLEAAQSAMSGVIGVISTVPDILFGLIKDLFSFAGIELPEFNMSEFMTGIVDDAVESVKSFFGLGMTDEEKAAKKLAKEKQAELNRQTAANEQESLDTFSPKNDKLIAEQKQAEINKQEAEREKAERNMFTDKKAGQAINAVKNEKQTETTVSGVDASTQNNNQINTNNNNVITTPDMSVGTDDFGFANAVFQGA